MAARIVLRAVLLATLVPATATAQDGPRGFFAPFLSLFGGGRPPGPPVFDGGYRGSRPEVTVRPRSYRLPRDETFDTAAYDRALGARAFCVRTCDGFYFPVGPASVGATARAQDVLCARLCPAATVALYSVPAGGDVAEAIGPGRRRYAELATAFRFRTELSPGCTCNGRPGGGLATLAPADDFTLRRGDIIAGALGPLVFTGGGHLPFRANQFVPARPRELGRELMRRFTVDARQLPAPGPSGPEPVPSQIGGELAGSGNPSGPFR